MKRMLALAGVAFVLSGTFPALHAATISFSTQTTDQLSGSFSAVIPDGIFFDGAQQVSSVFRELPGADTNTDQRFLLDFYVDFSDAAEPLFWGFGTGKPGLPDNPYVDGRAPAESPAVLYTGSYNNGPTGRLVDWSFSNFSVTGAGAGATFTGTFDFQVRDTPIPVPEPGLGSAAVVALGLGWIRRRWRQRPAA